MKVKSTLVPTKLRLTGAGANMELNKLANDIADWRQEKGFYTPCSLQSEKERDLMLGKLMLVVTEVAEAAEAVRHYDMMNFIEELADTMIRLLDICGTVGIDIDDAIRNKMIVNKSRPKKHDKLTSL